MSQHHSSFEPILVVGASVRAAVGSLLRAGFQPVAADLFADTDLRASCPTLHIDNFETGLHSAWNHFRPKSWMYTGGLENYPRLVESLARKCRLFGNNSDVLKSARDPFVWSECLRAAGCNVPEVAMDLRHRLADSPLHWLRKPIRSCGGRGITHVVITETTSPIRPCNPSVHFFQEFISGEPFGAQFVANGDECRLLGVCEQLIGTTWTGAKDFQYSGAIGPTDFDDQTTRSLGRIGRTLATSFKIRGIFGVDVVVNQQGVWPVEINPRYTASVELLEHFNDRLVLYEHVSAFLNEQELHESSRRRTRPLVAENSEPATQNSICGKAILFAREPITIRPAFYDFISAKNEASFRPTIVDVPSVGDQLDTGTPIATVFAQGSSRLHVLEQLCCLTCGLWDAALKVR